MGVCQVDLHARIERFFSPRRRYEQTKRIIAALYHKHLLMTTIFWKFGRKKWPKFQVFYKAKGIYHPTVTRSYRDIHMAKVSEIILLLVFCYDWDRHCWLLIRPIAWLLFGSICPLFLSRLLIGWISRRAFISCKARINSCRTRLSL